MKTNDVATGELNGITGPYTLRPTGNFRGDEAITRKCAPYWVVRYVGGSPYSILRDVRFGSLAQAEAFAATVGTEEATPRRLARKNGKGSRLPTVDPDVVAQILADE